MWDAWPRSRPLIISHRGLAPGHRENTLDAAQAAFQAGADAIEIDVRCTKDDVPILHHDPSLGSLPVAETALATLEAAAEELGCELARLDDVLATGRPVNCEIKDAGATEAVLERLGGSAAERVLVSSFDPDVLAEVNRRRPELATGLVLGRTALRRLLFSRRRRRRLAALLDGADPDVLAVHRLAFRLGLASTLLSLDRPLALWTVNRDRHLQEAMSRATVWGVITDRPARAHHARALVHPATGEEPMNRRTVRSNQDRA